MQFWASGVPLQLLLLATLLGVASLIRSQIGPLSRLGFPDAILAGMLGLALGPGVLNLLPLDTSVLEILVYHGLALVFIAVSLVTPPEGQTRADAKSLAFCIPTVAVLQGAIGLAVVLAWSSMGDPLFPGMGFMVPLGFSQGPGQALAMGAAWSELGMVNGAQIGLIMAALGFAVCCIVGIPAVAILKKKGLLNTNWEGSEDKAGSDVPPPAAPGGIEGLTQQLCMVGAVYLATWGLLTLITAPLAEDANLRPMLWGFHFIIGALLAIATRKALAKTEKNPLHNGFLERLGTLFVDFTTVAALSAVRIDVLGANLAPLLILAVAGGTVTFLVCIFIAKRAFSEYGYEHAVVMFGAATGTLPTGLALLRIIDPELKGPVASNYVLGSAGALAFGAPLLLVVMPLPVQNFPETFPGTTWLAMGICLAYAAALIVGWRLFGGLSFKART